MIEAFVNTLEFFPRGLVYVALGLIILVLSKFINDVVTHYRIDEEVVQKGNTAIALGLSGYFLGVILVFVGAAYQPFGLIVSDGWGFNREFAFDVLRVFLYSLAGIAALNLVRLLTEYLVLYKFSVRRELVERQNVAIGAVEFGMAIAIGLLIASSISGSGGGPDASLAFFGMGLVVLILFTLFYELTTPFNIHEEIEKNNLAVGITLGGNLIAIGLVIFKAVFGDFLGWSEGIAQLLTFAVAGFILLYLLRLIIDLALLPSTKVSDELVTGQNIGVAFIESTIVISAALVLLFAI